MDFSRDDSLVQVEMDDQGVAVCMLPILPKDFIIAPYCLYQPQGADILIVKINRPEKRNALSQKTIDALIAALNAVSVDPKIKVMVLTGSKTAGPFSGRCFQTD